MSKERAEQLAELVGILTNIRRKIHSIPTKQVVYKDVTFAQIKVIRHLNYCKKATMTDIAKSLGVKLPSATGLVDNLVNNGYLKRTYDSKDRRLVYVELSITGYQLLDAMSKRQRERLMKIRDSMTIAKWNEFVKALATIDALLDETRQL